MNDWGQPEGLSCVVVRDVSHLQRELEAIRFLGTRLERSDTRVLSLTSPIARFPPDRSVPGSVFALEGVRRVFSTLVLGQNVRTFLSPWSEALYWYLNELVVDGGELVLPIADRGSGKTRGWSLTALEELFEQPGEVVDGHFARFRARSDLARPASLLTWFVNDLSGIVHTQIVSRAAADPLQIAIDDPLAEELIVSGLDRLRHERRHDESLPRESSIDFTTQLSRLTRSVSYLMSGLAHKAAAVRFAVADYAPRKPQTVLDIGGALGFLAGELLLDPDLELQSGLTVEADPTYVAGALRMYGAFAPQLRGRMRMAVERAEVHEFEPATIVTMLSSLLYVPRDQRRAVLDRSWDCLDRGGILVVYEVLRTRPPGKDDAVQYTAAEIDKTLQRYGSVVRLSATTLRELSVQEAGQTSVFRVVAKL